MVLVIPSRGTSTSYVQQSIRLLTGRKVSFSSGSFTGTRPLSDLRIVFIVPMLHPNMKLLLTALAQEGTDCIVYYTHEVRAFSASDGVVARSCSVSRLARPYWLWKQRWKRRPIVSSDKWPSYVFLRRELRRLRPDVVVGRSSLLGWITIFFATVSLRIPTIAYSLRAAEVPFAASKSMQRLLRRVVAVTGAGALVRMTPFSDCGSAVVDHGFTRSHVVPFGVVFDTPPLADDHDNEATESGDTASVVRLLFVGSFSHFKRLDVLLDAVHRVAERHVVQLTIVGTTGDQRERHLFERVSELVTTRGIDDIVVVRRNVPHHKMARVYNTHDVFVSASKEIGGLACLEAMGAGLPVVVTDGLGVSRYVENERTGLVVRYGSVDELSQAVARLVEGAALRHRLGFNAYKYVRETHSAQAVVSSFAAVIADDTRVHPSA